uniref:Uncharacterized protein n=1 Tax=Anopheles epiroticus TaxID=199890 RepID=A0A182PVL7_9DIPT
MATAQTKSPLWKVLAAIVLLLVLYVADTASTSLVSSTRLRRVHKSTYSEAVSTDNNAAAAPAAVTGARTSSKGHLRDGHIGMMGRSIASKKTTLTTVKSTSTTLRQRVDQAVQMVRARSKEIKMEQEQKRVDRKLRRDQKKQEREQSSAPVAPINPHNLKMPDCPAGKVYNGRRCVAMGKMPKH